MQSFNRITLPVAQALQHVKNAAEMRALRVFFEDMLKETDASLRRAKGDQILQLQGRACLIEEFLTAVDTAVEVVEKLRNPEV